MGVAFLPPTSHLFRRRLWGPGHNKRALLREHGHLRSPRASIRSPSTGAVTAASAIPPRVVAAPPTSDPPPAAPVLNWGVTLPAELGACLLNASPPLVRLPGLLSPAECAALIAEQEVLAPAERDNYLNFDAGTGHGLRQGVSPGARALAPVLRMLRSLFPGREAEFAEELWVRPGWRTVVVRDATTVRYGPGEGVGTHVDGKDATLLVYLRAPTAGGATVFPDIPLRVPPVAGDALLYESRNGLLHFAEDVADGEKWVLQLLVDYRIRADDLEKRFRNSLR